MTSTTESLERSTARIDITASRLSAAPKPRASIPLRYWLEYAALRAFIMLADSLPLETTVRLNGWLWQTIAPLLARHRRADRHLAAMIPSYTAPQRQRILRDMWRNLGETFVESLLLHRLAADPDRIVLDPASMTILQRTIDEGGIIVCAHLGNWEAAVLPLAATGASHAVVYRGAKNPLVDTYMLGLRSRYYQGGLFAKGDAAARALLRCARAGKSLSIMADLRDASGPSVPFFGRPAPSTPFPALLARQFGRPIFAAALIRTGTARFRMETVEIPVPHTNDRSADIQTATAGIQAVFEQWIRQWPEQWMWAHRRYGS